jgi:hypothetical protein
MQPPRFAAGAASRFASLAQFFRFGRLRSGSSRVLSHIASSFARVASLVAGDIVPVHPLPQNVRHLPVAPSCPYLIWPSFLSGPTTKVERRLAVRRPPSSACPRPALGATWRWWREPPGPSVQSYLLLSRPGGRQMQRPDTLKTIARPRYKRPPAMSSGKYPNFIPPLAPPRAAMKARKSLSVATDVGLSKRLSGEMSKTAHLSLPQIPHPFQHW